MKINKVMIVDDDEDIRTVAELVVRRIGNWEVVSAASGEEALAIVGSERPDVILLDALMPQLDGLATMAKLREEPATAGIPVIFMTARVQQHDIETYLAHGARGVISKPFDVTTLPDEIRGILRDA